VRIAACSAILRTTASSPQIVFTIFLRFSYVIIFNFDPQIAQVGLRRKKERPIEERKQHRSPAANKTAASKKENPRWYELVS
jgi:hypothetical protein